VPPPPDFAQADGSIVGSGEGGGRCRNGSPSEDQAADAPAAAAQIGGAGSSGEEQSADGTAGAAGGGAGRGRVRSRGAPPAPAAGRRKLGPPGGRDLPAAAVLVKARHFLRCFRQSLCVLDAYQHARAGAALHARARAAAAALAQLAQEPPGARRAAWPLLRDMTWPASSADWGENWPVARTARRQAAVEHALDLGPGA